MATCSLHDENMNSRHLPVAEGRVFSRMYAYAQADSPDIVLFPGDLSYADDYNLIDKFGYQPRWDTWGRLTQPAFATVPLVTGIGA